MQYTSPLMVSTRSLHAPGVGVVSTMDVCVDAVLVFQPVYVAVAYTLVIGVSIALAYILLIAVIMF